MEIPLEDNEQKALVKWLELVRLKFTSIPNSTFAGSYFGGQKQKSFAVLARNKALGLRKGFPDIVVVIPPKRSKTQKGIFRALELKRQHRVKKNGKLGTSPSVVSDEQVEWIDSLNSCEGVEARICYGFSESINFIKTFLNE